MFFSEAPEEQLVLECLPEIALADLTVEDRELLKSPEERWASLVLPKQLKSQVLHASASNKHTNKSENVSTRGWN